MIYFDNSATTKPCGAALAKMNEALTNTYGNPSSVHFAGGAARHMLDDARTTVAASLGIKRAEGKVIFTSCGTEANNLALFGTVYSKVRHEKGGTRGKVIITEGEHSSVEKCAVHLEDDGFTVVRIPTRGGALDMDTVRRASESGNVIIASLMLVNNETGAVYDVKRAAEIIRKSNPDAVIHSDCVQGYMKRKITLSMLGADMISVSSHKVYAPKGAGALAVSQKIITAKKLVPYIFGGGQEESFRSGTENVPAIAAFGAAVGEGMNHFDERCAAIRAVRDELVRRFSDTDGIRMNIPPVAADNILNITIPGIKSEVMLNFLSGRGICVSAGSACSTHGKGVSRPLHAFGLTDADADCSLRLSLSYTNTPDEADAVADAVSEGIATLARIR